MNITTTSSILGAAYKAAHAITGTDGPCISIITDRALPETIAGVSDKLLDVVEKTIEMVYRVRLEQSQPVMSARLIRQANNLCQLGLTFEVRCNPASARELFNTAFMNGELQDPSIFLEMGVESENHASFRIEFAARCTELPAEKMMNCWLQGRMAHIIEFGRRSRTRDLERMLKACGSQVMISQAQSHETIDNILHDGIRMNRMVVFADLSCFTLTIDQIQEVLDNCLRNGHLTGRFDIYFLINPWHLDELHQRLRSQTAKHLICQPLTRHRLFGSKDKLPVINTHFPEIPQEMTEGKQILLVEDNELTSKLVAGFLQTRGFAVRVAATGEEAIELASEVLFDAVLLDLHLPKMNGFDTATGIRQIEKYAGTPILAITATRERSDLRRCFEVGMDDCLSKPLNFSELARKVRYWLTSNEPLKTVGPCCNQSQNQEGWIHEPRNVAS